MASLKKMVEMLHRAKEGPACTEQEWEQKVKVATEELEKLKNTKAGDISLSEFEEDAYTKKLEERVRIVNKAVKDVDLFNLDFSTLQGLSKIEE